MNKLIALVLLFAVPVFAQQQVNLVPAAEQAEAPVVKGEAPAEEGPPLYTRWYVWAITGVASVAVVSAIVLVATTAFRNNGGCSNFAPCPGGGAGGLGGTDVSPPPTK